MSVDLSLEHLKGFQHEFEKKDKYKVMQGALRNTNITSIAADPMMLNRLPFRFNHELREKITITDQRSSGRCWIFAGLNIVRRKMIAKFRLSPDFQLSQAYMMYCDKLEKCNTALETIYHLARKGKDCHSIEYPTIIPTLLSDGGTWQHFVNVVLKYGLVPREAYPDTFNIANTAFMNSILEMTVKKTSTAITKTMDRATFSRLKLKALEECYRVLTICMGNPPQTFEWSPTSKKKPVVYTPLAFYKRVVEPLVQIDSFIAICNDPRNQYNQLLAIEHMHNVLSHGDSDLSRKHTNTYVNVDLPTFKAAISKSLSKNMGVWFACDFSRYIYDSSYMDQEASNISEIFDIDLDISKRDAMLSCVTAPNHAMLLAGVQKDGNNFARWKVENSHGSETKLRGFLTMSDRWFDNFVICAAVPKDCLPVKLQKVDKVKWLPYWDILGLFAD